MGFLDSGGGGGGAVDPDQLAAAVSDAISAQLPDAIAGEVPDLITQGITDAGVLTSADMPTEITAYSLLTLSAINNTTEVTVSAGDTQGSAGITSNSRILGIYPVDNQDQFITAVDQSGETVTITLGAPATADNNFQVVFVPLGGSNQ